MIEIIGIAIASFFGAVAWLYQTALARQERRAAQYARIIDSLPGFMVGGNPATKAGAITAHRHLWVLGPPSVVRAGNEFFEAAKGSGADALVPLKKFVIEMRRDTRLFAVMFPWHRGEISTDDIQLYS